MKKMFVILPVICFVLGSCCDRCNSANEDACVQNSGSHADWAITTKVKTAIMSEPSVSGSSRFVSVTTNNGVVTLTGSVSSKSDANKIVRIAKSVDGVVRVDNQMTVSNS